MSELQYLNLVEDVIQNGKLRSDRTGVGTLSVFGRQVRYDLSKGFPLLTSKKMNIKSVIAELLWFIEGSSDERRLAEILYDRPREELNNKTTIWTANSNAEYWKHKAEFLGDCGRIYPMQWRRWINKDGKVIDQLQNTIDNLKKEPNSRRHLIVAFNPGELDQMCLPPCHVMFQFYVNDNKLSCMWTQRSVDLPLGLPYNIASYALLTHMIAQICNLNVGELIGSFGDCHIYLNQIDGCREQLQRSTHKLPQLILNKQIQNINEFNMKDFSLQNYVYEERINFPFSV
jgi:thymidylate synthase